MRWFGLFLLVLVLFGCRTTSLIDAAKDKDGEIGGNITDPMSLGALNPFMLVGTPLMLTGGILLFITQGRRGWWGLLTGAGLCALAYWLIRYSHVIFYPIVAVMLIYLVYHLFFRIPKEVKKNGIPLVKEPES